MSKILKTFIFICLFISQLAFSKVDYGARAVTRSFPIALALQGDVGYGAKFWEANKVMYGYVRAAGVYSISGLVNLAGAKVEIFPVSFLGFYAQADKSQRKFDLDLFDCNAVECNETVDRNRIGAKLGLAFGRFFLMGDYQIIDVEANTDKPLFADLQHTLIGKSIGDQVKRLQVIAGFKLNESLSLITIYISQEMQENYNRDFMRLIGLKKDVGNLSYMTTAGVFRTRDNATVATVLFAIQWNGHKGVKLF